MHHAFIISVHKGFAQIKLLLTSMQYADVYIHVDKKADLLYRQLRAEYDTNPHVHIIERRIQVNWSGFSIVEAMLALMKAVKESGNTYDYIHSISGQDLPLMNHEKIDNFIIQAGYGRQFIEYEDIGTYAWRIKCYSFFRENPKNRTILYRGVDIMIRLLQLPFLRRKNLKGYHLYKGSSWFSITQDCLDYIIEHVDKSEYVKQFQYTACPDEHFFQILILNSEFREKVYNHNFRYIHFETLKSSPIVLRKEHKDKFMNGQYLFARKFDIDIDSDIITEVLSDIGV